MIIIDCQTLDHVKMADPDLVLFSGSKDPETGISWCPDCTAIEPVMQKLYDNPDYSKTRIAICSIERSVWKDQANEFRTGSLRLKSVPTLLVWRADKKRLAESQCLDQGMIDMIMEEIPERSCSSCK